MRNASVTSVRTRCGSSKPSDFAVTFPEGVGLCWAAEPICTKRPNENVRLRDPAAGPAGGFVRVGNGG